MTQIKVGDFIVYGRAPTPGQVRALGRQQATIDRLRVRDGIVSAETWGGMREHARSAKTAIRFETAQQAWDYVQELRERFGIPELEESSRAADRALSAGRTAMADAFAVELIQKGAKE